jgi:hypothetical protein
MERRDDIVISPTHIQMKGEYCKFIRCTNIIPQSVVVKVAYRRKTERHHHGNLMVTPKFCCVKPESSASFVVRIPKHMMSCTFELRFRYARVPVNDSVPHPLTDDFVMDILRLNANVTGEKFMTLQYVADVTYNEKYATTLDTKKETSPSCELGEPCHVWRIGKKRTHFLDKMFISVFWRYDNFF